MSERNGANTHDVLEVIFRAMNIKVAKRDYAQPRLPNWVNGFPYVNGGLFSGATDVSRFTRMARIRMFDPACSSGNFLVIAYKQMREIEA